jgi:hypothetical protein
MPFSPSQGKIICTILKMDDNLHLKSCEKTKFRLAKFPNKTTKLIHQMWDKIVIMIVIKKENIMVTTSEATQIVVEGSSMIKAPKKQKKEVTIKEKKEKIIDNLIIKKYPKGLDETESKHVKKSIKSKFSNSFPFGNKHVERVKVPVDRFLPPLGRSVYHPLNDTHKNEIKHRILMFHYIDQQCPIFAIPTNPKYLTKILEMHLRNWFVVSNLIFFIVGG